MNTRSKDTKIESYIRSVIAYANVHLSLWPENNTYYFNTMCALLRVRPTAPVTEGMDYAAAEAAQSPVEVVRPLTEYALKEGMIYREDAEVFACGILGTVMPRPSAVIRIFNSFIDNDGVRAAFDWFYDLCKSSGYISKDTLDLNIRWNAPCDKGELCIVVNAARPEFGGNVPKTGKKAAAAADAGKTYPQCLLCRDNVGFSGDSATPRQTLRVLPLVLDGGDYFFQYSPYNYYPHHFVVSSAEHRQMTTDGESFRSMLSFAEQFPQFFIARNADLPRIGGSIMSHDHFQGGLYEVPLFAAPARLLFDDPARKIKVSVPDFYSTVIRLEGKDTAALADAAARINDAWTVYDNERLNITAATKGERHNAVSACARRTKDGGYCLELILRNNRADAANPDGIFHTAPRYLHIKRESLGVMEVMGLFVLPGRLSRETAVMRDYLNGAAEFDYDAVKKGEMSGFADTVRDMLAAKTEGGDAGEAVERHINEACVDMVTRSAVFKGDAAGNIALIRFLNGLGYELAKDF
jgi:UDPglucose--hexose-1-phosphate uridylyltransferase